MRWLLLVACRTRELTISQFVLTDEVGGIWHFFGKAPRDVTPIGRIGRLIRCRRSASATKPLLTRCRKAGICLIPVSDAHSRRHMGMAD